LTLRFICSMSAVGGRRRSKPTSASEGCIFITKPCINLSLETTEATKEMSKLYGKVEFGACHYHYRNSKILPLTQVIDLFTAESFSSEL